MSKRRLISWNFFGSGEFRLLLLALLLLAGLLILWGALFQEQIQRGEKHRQKISRQTIRRVRIPARRGNIYSADLRLLAGSGPECALLFYPEEMRDGGRRSRTIDFILQASRSISAAIGRPDPLTRENVTRHLNTRPGLPITVFKALSVVETAQALEAARLYRGIDVVPASVRRYPGGTLAANLIGYVQSENPRFAPDRNDFFYYIPDLIGASGLEKAFDRLPERIRKQADAPEAAGLRGQPGYTLEQVDHLGFVTQHDLEKQEPRHGNHLILTIDSRAQKIAEEVLGSERGALVVVDADTGDILAAATAPRPDLGKFSPALSKEYYQQLLLDPAKPLYDRALNGVYQPGSILKPLVSLAFLNGGMDPENVVNCDGKTQVGNAAIRCASWRSGGHGSLNLRGALEHSCNDYLIENGIRTGLEPIAEVLRSAGIGEKTALELPQQAGIFPSDEMKRRRQHYGWNRYDTALLSIGQGIIGVTPLQAALFTAAIANCGTLYEPHLVKEVIYPNSQTVYQRRVKVNRKLAASKESLRVVQLGMYDVVNSPTGSGRRAAVEGLAMSGKTGTAEAGSRAHRTQFTWFVAFTEYKGRRYASALLVENGRSGGGTCAPMTGEFYRRYLIDRGMRDER